MLSNNYSIVEFKMKVLFSGLNDTSPYKNRLHKMSSLFVVWSLFIVLILFGKIERLFKYEGLLSRRVKND